ncbi:MAG: hypothetical protein A2007_04775 [Verrucomicrobia bacterium GWC2_42_7]|nr:MAG: hypothetical protein A2007_04775 [Verrucomicrobia bacterium GWC2_42_7]
MNLENKSDNHRVWYQPETQTIFFEGTLRMGGVEEYASISSLLDDIFHSKPTTLTLDLKKLDFLNSSGISVLAKFVIAARKDGTVPLVIKGSSQIPWQGKSLPNLKKLYTSLQLTVE